MLGVWFVSVRQLMKANASVEDDELECVERSQRFKLTCPITLMRMAIPARGRDCRHLQCFDLESFIQVTKGSKAFNNRWKCPECPLILRSDVLVIDPFVAEILKIVRTQIFVVSWRAIFPDLSLDLYWRSLIRLSFFDESNDHLLPNWYDVLFLDHSFQKAPNNVDIVEASCDGSYSFISPCKDGLGEQVRRGFFGMVASWCSMMHGLALEGMTRRLDVLCSG